MRVILTIITLALCGCVTEITSGPKGELLVSGYGLSDKVVLAIYAESNQHKEAEQAIETGKPYRSRNGDIERSANEYYGFGGAYGDLGADAAFTLSENAKQQALDLRRQVKRNTQTADANAEFMIKALSKTRAQKKKESNPKEKKEGSK